MSAAEQLKNEGNARRAAGDPAQAVACYRRALEAQPDYLPALYNLGLVLRELGELGEAEACFRQVVDLDPNEADALIHLGALRLRSAPDEAEGLFRRAVALAPGNAFLWLQLGELAMARGAAEEALSHVARALEIDPSVAEAHNLRGMLLRQQGRLDAAIECFQRAAELSPQDPAPRNNLGGVLVVQERLDEAVAQFERAIALQPGFVEAQVNLGGIHSSRGKRDLAVRAFAEAHRNAPGNPDVVASLLFEMQQVCDWSRFDELCAARRAGIGDEAAQRIDPFSLLSLPTSRAEQLRAARQFAAREQRAVAQERERLAFRFERGEKPRLRIGYLSADFREHAVAHLAAELFELHDRGRFEVHAYSYGPDDGSPMRRRLERSFDRFTDIRPLAHADAARAIHRDGIDVLVDLTGYTQHARTRIMALRPAPVQVNFLGYPGTMGAEFIDYIVSDACITPREHAADYSEELVLLPHAYQPNDRTRLVPPAPPRERLGLPRDAVVFCCFNQPYKILPPIFAAWMRILEATPGSVLWVLEQNRLALQNLRSAAARHGVDPGRLIGAPGMPHAEHLGRLQAADLFLDTLPYNAHTSASDSLWAGLPVLTCAGETFAARVGASLVRAAGVPELAVASMEEYEKRAVALACDPAALRALRDKVARNRASCPLFDTPAFARHLEAAFEEMWRQKGR